MKFAFDTDEVLRDTISKIKATYEKFFIEDYVSEEGEEEFEYKIIEPITSHKFSEHFLFPSDADYINFMYLDFPMNIFGHSPSMSANTFNTFSEIQKTVLSKRDKLSVIGMGVAKIKPASLFFYSKYGMEVDNIQFYNKKTIKKFWSKFDVIVTANPDLLEIKPKNKISIKINTDYNQNYESDYSIDSIEGFTSVYNELKLKHAKIFGETYHIDFDKIENLISIKQTDTGDTEQNVSIVKFELIKTMLDVVLSEVGDIDEKMGLKGSNDLTIPFKIAFNTLLRYEIIQTL